MKKFITVLASFLTAAGALFAAEPAIAFDQTAFDFGNIHEENGTVSHRFQFTNTGDAPLIIISANASCGCTRPEFPKEPIMPGDSAVIKITYMPQGRPGEFNKSVRVRTNAKRSKNVSLKISGVVIPQNH